MTYFGVFIVNFEQISHIVLFFPLLNLYMPAGWLDSYNINFMKNVS